MIMGFVLLDMTRAGVLPHRRTLLVEEADKLSWLSTSMEAQSSPWEPAERDVLAQSMSSVSTRPRTADIEDEYGLSKGAFQMALGELGLGTPQANVFGSAPLPKCLRVWTKENNGWKRGWGSNLLDLLYIHAPRSCLEVGAKIVCQRARAVVTIPSLEVEDAKDAGWVEDLRCMTLIDTQLPSIEDIYADAHGIPLPPPAEGWTTTVAYVDGCLAHPDRNMGMSSIRSGVRLEECTIVDRPNCIISRIMALLVCYGEETADGSNFPPRMAQDALSPHELELVCGYMSNPIYLGVPFKAPFTKSWWEDPALLMGRITRN